MEVPRKPTPLELERYLLTEQSPAERALTERRLAPAAREQLQNDDAQLRAQLFARLPPERLVERVTSAARAAGRAPSAARPWRAWAPLSVAVACAALAVVLITSRSSERAGHPLEERAKGLELDLRIYRKLPDGVERLRDGDWATAGDVLQLGYVRDVYAFGMLLSIDGRGAVTLHQPSQPSASSELPGQRGAQLVPEAYELDDAPDFERFIFVAAHQPLAVDEVLAAAHQLAREPARARGEPLLLTVRTAQRSFLLRKPSAR